MLKKLSRLTIICCFMLAAPAWADNVEDIYQVDVIFFEQLDPKRFDAEVWPKNAGRLNTAGAIPLGKARPGVSTDSVDIMNTLNALDEAGDVPVENIIKASIDPVSPEHMLLREEANIIKHSKNLRFIQQVAWTQPMAQNVKSTPVLVNAGNDITAVIDVKPVQRTFHINVDMLFKSDHGNRQGVREFKLKQEVRVKRREVFYVDHPLVGMMVMVTPVIMANNSPP
jgi:hypothetical protein